MMKFLITFVIWCVCEWMLVKASCVIDPSVTSDTERNNQQKLLQTLDPIVGTRAKQLTDKTGNLYDFVVCADIDQQHKNVSIIQTITGTKKQNILGFNNQTLVSSQGTWLMLTLQGGAGDTAYQERCNKTQRQAHIFFVCDPLQKELEIHTVGEVMDEPCYLLFVVRHQIVCPTAPKEGLGGGSIFLIIMLVTVGAYFIFGFCYLRMVTGAKGIEQIPNREFWFKIGNILADGCGAIFRCDQYCGGGRVSGGASSSTSYDGYSPIEERMARDLQDTDRDSALLHP